MNELQSTGATTSSGSSHNIGGAVLATAGLVAAATLLGAKPSRAAVSPALTFSQIPGTGDVQILNYALALETLEADLYAQALLRLTTGGTNALGQTITGLNLPSSQPDVAYITEFAVVEAQHRDFLNSALGTASIIGTGTNGILAGAKFDFGFADAAAVPNNTRQDVIQLVYTAEATGVGAYLGAVPLLAPKSPYLAIAAAIQGTEARHTAAIAIVFNALGFTPLKDTAPLVGQTETIVGLGPVTSGIDGTLDPNTVLSISRVLCLCGHLSGTIRCRTPQAVLTRRIGGQRHLLRSRAAKPQPVFSGLASDGVCRADMSPRRRCALTAPFHPYREDASRQIARRYLSVALSVGSPRLAVNEHRAL